MIVNEVTVVFDGVNCSFGLVVRLLIIVMMVLFVMWFLLLIWL